jgi:hypothetical protein
MNKMEGLQRKKMAATSSVHHRFILLMLLLQLQEYHCLPGDHRHPESRSRGLPWYDAFAKGCWYYWC